MQLDYGYSTMERQMMRKATERGIPINGSIELLPVCNMNCDMCYVRISHEEMERLGGLRSVKEWLSVAQEMKDAGVLYLLLTGGEPLLYPGFQELYTELSRMGMVLTINTNGTLIDEKWADFFAKEKPRRINITLYGSSKDSYESLCHYGAGFEKVKNAVRLLAERDIDVKLATSMTGKNIAELDSLHKVAEDLGLVLHTDTYMMPSVRERSLPFDYQVRLAPEDAARARVAAFEKELPAEAFLKECERKVWEVENILPEEGPYHNHCHAGRCSFTLNWQGMLHPCVVLDVPEACVFEEGFLPAWKRISEEFLSHTMSEECSGCRYRPVCRNCLGCALLETGEYDQVPEYMCRYARETYVQMKERLTEWKKEGEGNDYK